MRPMVLSLECAIVAGVVCLEVVQSAMSNLSISEDILPSDLRTASTACRASCE